MSISLPIAEWLEDTLESKGVAGSIPGGGIHYHFEILSNERYSHPGEYHTNEIKHDIHPE